MLTDEAMLCFLQNLKICCGDDVAKARSVYDAARAQTTNEPDFEEALTAGWLSVVWGRVSITTGVRPAARASPSMTALKTLMSGIFGCTYELSDTARGNAELFDLVGPIERGETEIHNVGSQSPEWVAARLWDRGLADQENSSAALRTWVDCWNILGRPSLLAEHAWGEVAAERFRKAVQNLLQSEPGLLDWNSSRETLIKSAAAARVLFMDVSSLDPAFMHGLRAA